MFDISMKSFVLWYARYVFGYGEYIYGNKVILAMSFYLITWYQVCFLIVRRFNFWRKDDFKSSSVCYQTSKSCCIIPIQSECKREIVSLTTKHTVRVPCTFYDSKNAQLYASILKSVLEALCSLLHTVMFINANHKHIPNDPWK